MEKLSAISVAFSNATPTQAELLTTCWTLMFGKGSDYFGQGKEFDVYDIYDETTQRLKLWAEVAGEPLPDIYSAEDLSRVIDWVVEEKFLLYKDPSLWGVVYQGSFVVTEEHLKAPLNVVNLFPKVSVLNTETEEGCYEALH